MFLDDLVDLAQSQVTEVEREALWARGVSNKQIDLYRIGFLHEVPSWDFPERFSRVVEKCIHDTLVFPLTNPLGEIQGVQFRPVDRNRKRFSEYYHDNSQLSLFGLGQAMPFLWDTRTAWLVEGVFDLFPIQREIPNTFATLTAAVSKQTLTFLKRVVDKLVFVYDNDQTGREGAASFERYHSNDFKSISIVKLPKISKGPEGGFTKDPGDLWETLGDLTMSDYVKNLRLEHEWR